MDDGHQNTETKTSRQGNILSHCIFNTSKLGCYLIPHADDVKEEISKKII